jgi:selenocysteine-specific elongation factor
MYVVATAGHVDHGKSTLVRMLTGMEPDRWAEERRRGLTIDLGFAWTELSVLSEPSGRAQLAFVDVPGHERFVSHMLAGVGPVPAAMVVVAADQGWQPQSTEHLAALDAVGVRHGLLVVTRSDLADPAPARTEALERLAGSSLGTVPAVVVSGRTGAGLAELRRELGALCAGLPEPELAADVRLWVDRSFSIRGAGTVVTGTLPAGSVRTGDELLAVGPGLPGEGRLVRVRGLQALGREESEVPAVARVAVNLRGVERSEVGRGTALLSVGRWLTSEVVDVSLRYDSREGAALEPKGSLVLHVGSAAVPARVRRLGPTTARLTLGRPLPLRTGDRGLLRDPGRRQLVGIVVLDVRPPALRRRGAARDRGDDLAEVAEAATPERRRALMAETHLRTRGAVHGSELRAMGLPPPGAGARRDHGWYVDPGHWAQVVQDAVAHVSTWAREHPVAAGMPADALRQRLDLPTEIVDGALRAAGLAIRDGLVQARGADRSGLPPALDEAVRMVEKDLAAAPFAAPGSRRLADLGLGARELAAAVRSGRLLKIADGIVLLPDAIDRACQVLACLPQPFTLSQARIALATTRRVAVPLLELLDQRGLTERLPDDTHRVRPVE